MCTANSTWAYSVSKLLHRTQGPYQPGPFCPEAQEAQSQPSDAHISISEDKGLHAGKIRPNLTHSKSQVRRSSRSREKLAPLYKTDHCKLALHGEPCGCI